MVIVFDCLLCLQSIFDKEYDAEGDSGLKPDFGDELDGDDGEFEWTKKSERNDLLIYFSLNCIQSWNFLLSHRNLRLEK